MADPVDHSLRSARTAELVEQLHAVVYELEQLHPGRKFTPDGHLVGSIGEAAAEALFDLTLTTASTAGHDAVDAEQRKVEIKATYGGRNVLIRATSEHAAQRLIVLKLSKSPGLEHEVVYNGPLSPALLIAGPIQSNGQASMSLTKLRALNTQPRPHERVRLRAAPENADSVRRGGQDST